MKKSLCVVWIVLLVLCCSCAKKEEPVVRIAYFPNLTHAQALVGISNGMFQEAIGDAVSIRWHEFNAGPAELQALMAGELDIGYIGPVPAINGFVKSNGDIQMIAGAAKGGSVLVSQSDLGVVDVSELSGKKVAVPQYGNTQHLLLLNMLREHGLSTTDKGGTVEVLQADNPDIKTLLDTGNIDAACVPEPWGARLIHEVDANLVIDQKDLWRDGDYDVTVVVARTEFVKQHPDIVQNFLRAHVGLTEYICENPEESKKIANDTILELTKKGFEQVVLDEAFERIAFSSEPSVESNDGYIRLLMEEGFIKECKNQDALFDQSGLEKIK